VRKRSRTIRWKLEKSQDEIEEGQKAAAWTGRRWGACVSARRWWCGALPPLDSFPCSLLAAALSLSSLSSLSYAICVFHHVLLVAISW
jgi:hypothetical protein